MLERATYFRDLGHRHGEKFIPVHVTFERADVHDIVELFAWNVQIVVLIPDVEQRDESFAGELNKPSVHH